MLEEILDQPSLVACFSLRRVICVGAPLAAATAAACAERLPRVALETLYAPDQLGIGFLSWSFGAETGDHHAILGRPLPYVEAYVLDEQLRPTPVGLPGMLYLGGPGLPRGFASPTKTAEHYIPHPYGAELGAELYRTGELVRKRSDGVIECFGVALPDHTPIRETMPEVGTRGSSESPRTELEQQIASIVLDVVGIEQISIYDNFFRSGRNLSSHGPDSSQYPGNTGC